MELYEQGLAPREIAGRVGRTRRQVNDYISNFKQRGGPATGKTPGRKSRTPVPADLLERVTKATTDRSLAMYLISVCWGYGPSQTAKAFGCVHGTVVAACYRIEDMRDDPELDDWIEKNSPGY